MMYFYRIGNCVLESDKIAARHENDQSQRFRLLVFDENATVSVVEPGDTYEPDEK